MYFKRHTKDPLSGYLDLGSGYRYKAGLTLDLTGLMGTITSTSQHMTSLWSDGRMEMSPVGSFVWKCDSGLKVCLGLATWLIEVGHWKWTFGFYNTFPAQAPRVLWVPCKKPLLQSPTARSNTHTHTHSLTEALPQLPSSLSKLHPSESPPTCSSSPWDAQDLAYRVFKTWSLSMSRGFSSPHPPDHPGVPLLRINLVFLIWPDLIYCIGRET